MTVLIQRALASSVSVDKETVGEIEKGAVIFVGVFDDDSEEQCDYLAKKIISLRIFSDKNGKMNLSLLDTLGEILVISNFTLCADARKGTRPSYDKACRPERAQVLYDLFCEKLVEYGIKRVEKGIFGADMRVSVENDGPVSVILDTNNLMQKSR